MPKGPTFVDPDDGVVVDVEYAPFNVWTGRDTSLYAMTEFSPSITKQEFADESDINTIMARYQVTGTVPQNPDRQPFYVDAVDIPDYMEAQNILIGARDSFAALPAKVRREFDNDPAQFVAFANDPANADKLAEWGMLSPEAVELRDAKKRQAALDAAQAAASATPPPRPAGAQDS